MHAWVRLKPPTLTQNVDCGFLPSTTVPKIITSSASKKGPRICCPFPPKESQQANPLEVPQRGLYGEKYPLTVQFYLSLNISHFIFPSDSPVREPPPCFLTGSPWAAILCYQSHWSPLCTKFLYGCNSFLLLLFQNIFCDPYVFVEDYLPLYHWDNFALKWGKLCSEQVL